MHKGKVWIKLPVPQLHKKCHTLYTHSTQLLPSQSCGEKLNRIKLTLDLGIVIGLSIQRVRCIQVPGPGFWFKMLRCTLTATSDTDWNHASAQPCADSVLTLDSCPDHEECVLVLEFVSWLPDLILQLAWTEMLQESRFIYWKICLMFKYWELLQTFIGRLLLRPLFYKVYSWMASRVEQF